MLRNPEGKTGEFQESSYGKWFTYQATQNPWALEMGFTHEVDVLDGVRFARVLKTVAHVCVDEDDAGNAVTEPWKLKKHSVYQH